MDEASSTVIRVEHHHIHEHRHIHEVRSLEQAPEVRDEELAAAIDAWEEREAA